MDAVSGTPGGAGSGFSSRLRRFAGLWENARPGDWWEFKIPPLLATAYATALLLHVSFQQLWPLLLLLLFALLPGAAYVSVLNDITDLQDDIQCGKTNRMVGRSGAFKFFALALCLLLGLGAGLLLRHFPLTLGFYAATWVAYTLYSVPPFRLKVRGIWGVAMDASGAHLFPTLWTASLIVEATGHALPIFFLVSLGIWASALGLRGILWHQLYDRENDRLGHVSTFAARKDPESIRLFVARVAFPLEMLALGIILVQLETPWAWAVLAGYLAMEWMTRRFMAIDLILVQPTVHFRIIFAEYYQLWYPLTFLIAMAQQSWWALMLIALQLILFPHCFYVFLCHANFIVGQRLVPALRRKIELLIHRSLS
jgi:4-hydroxybenzoate polyprenyltransferase